MDQGPLVAEKINAGATFLRDLSTVIPIRVAFWLKDSNEGRLRLYLAADQFNGARLRPAYEEVLRVDRALNNPNFDVFQVQLIGTNERVVQGVLDYLRRVNWTMPIHLTHRVFGGVEADEVYIYPPINSAGRQPTPAGSP
jgi:hypothetical protein